MEAQMIAGFSEDGDPPQLRLIGRKSRKSKKSNKKSNERSAQVEEVPAFHGLIGDMRARGATLRPQMPMIMVNDTIPLVRRFLPYLKPVRERSILAACLLATGPALAACLLWTVI